VHRVQAARDERYAALRGYFHGASDVTEDPEHSYMRLHSVTLREQAAAAGRRIEDLGLDAVGAEVTALRRAGEPIEAGPGTELRAGDVVVLRGSADAVTRAEGLLL